MRIAGNERPLVANFDLGSGQQPIQAGGAKSRTANSMIEPWLQSDPGVTLTMNDRVARPDSARTADRVTTPLAQHEPIHADPCRRKPTGGLEQIIGKLFDLLRFLIQILFGGAGGAGYHAMHAADKASPQKSAPNAERPSTGGKGGVHVDGPNGFLWKPVSDSNKKLAILTPKELGDVKSVVVRDSNGRVLETGKKVPGGFADHRGLFRFNRAGADFPPNVTVEVQLANGTTKTYPIADPSQRYD